MLGTDGEPDADDFWGDVSKNLAARRLRLPFVADAIPDPLARVATFLNAQMPGIEILAVEIERFRGESVQTVTVHRRVDCDGQREDVWLHRLPLCFR